MTDPEPLGRSLRCPQCGRDLRSCKNCKFYLSGSRGDCSEAQGEHPADKERGNFCDWFSLNPLFKVPSGGQKSAQASEAKARSDFDALFGS